MSPIEITGDDFMASIRLGRTILLAIAIEVVSILGLVVIVAMAGSHDQSAAMAFAERTGAWFGPLAGVVLCLAGGHWVGKRSKTRQVLAGAVVGAVVALSDVVLLVMGNVEVVAGTAGGLLALRGR